MAFGFSDIIKSPKDVLGSAGDFLFGKGADVDTGTVGKWNKGQQQLFDLLQTYLNKGISPGTAYPGQLPGTTPLSNIEQLSLAGLEKMFSGEGAFGQAGETLTGMLQVKPEDIDKAYRSTVSDPLMQQFQEEIMPAIKRAGAPRLWGTDYQTQEQYAARDLERALVKGRGDITENYLNRALQAATTGLSGLMGATETGMRVGAVPRQIEEAGLTAEYNEWMRQQKEEQMKVNQFLAALGLQPYDTYAFAEPAQPGLIQTFLGSQGGSNLTALGILKMLSAA